MENFKSQEFTSQEMLDLAILELKNLEFGSKFIVKDLFKGHLWNRQKTSTRLTLGTLFLNYAKENSSIIILEKNSSNQQIYEYCVKNRSIVREADIFNETGKIEISKTNDDIIFLVIGDSGLNRIEKVIKSEYDIESFNLILKDYFRKNKLL